MKDKILYLIIGTLIGAIITAGCFLLFGKNNDKGGMRGAPGQMQMDGNMTPSDRNGRGGRDSNMTRSDEDNSSITQDSNTQADTNVSNS